MRQQFSKYTAFTLSTIISFSLCLLSVFPLLSRADADQVEQPGQHVMKAIEQVRGIVVAEEGKTPEEDLQKHLRGIIEPLFDFREMAQRCLGANWSKGNPDEREEFVQLFTNLLSRTYLKKIRDSVQSTKVMLVGEVAKDGKALVKTTIDNGEDKAALDYRLILSEGNWRVYDVVIENVGLVSNYRNEFAGIIRKEGFAGLLKRLREKEDHKEEEKS